MHDYSAVSEFAEEVVVMTSGPQSRVNVTHMIRTLDDYIEESSPLDWLVISGPTVLNCVACVLFERRHGRLNLLIHTSRDDRYIPRTIVFPAIGEE